MITTTEIFLYPAMAPAIRCYSFGEFNTKGFNLLKRRLASQETSIFFFFHAIPLPLKDTQAEQITEKGIQP